MWNKQLRNLRQGLAGLSNSRSSNEGLDFEIVRTGASGHPKRHHSVTASREVVLAPRRAAPPSRAARTGRPARRPRGASPAVSADSAHRSELTRAPPRRPAAPAPGPCPSPAPAPPPPRRPGHRAAAAAPPPRRRSAPARTRHDRPPHPLPPGARDLGSPRSRAPGGPRTRRTAATVTEPRPRRRPRPPAPPPSTASPAATRPPPVPRPHARSRHAQPRTRSGAKCGTSHVEGSAETRDMGDHHLDERHRHAMPSMKPRADSRGGSEGYCRVVDNSLTRTAKFHAQKPQRLSPVHYAPSCRTTSPAPERRRSARPSTVASARGYGSTIPGSIPPSALAHRQSRSLVRRQRRHRVEQHAPQPVHVRREHLAAPRRGRRPRPSRRPRPGR